MQEWHEWRNGELGLLSKSRRDYRFRSEQFNAAVPRINKKLGAQRKGRDVAKLFLIQDRRRPNILVVAYDFPHIGDVLSKIWLNQIRELLRMALQRLHEE